MSHQQLNLDGMNNIVKYQSNLIHFSVSNLRLNGTNGGSSWTYHCYDICKLLEFIFFSMPTFAQVLITYYFTVF